MTAHPDDDQLDAVLRDYLEMRGRPNDGAMGPADMVARVSAQLSMGGGRQMRAAQRTVAVVASLLVVGAGIAAVAALQGSGSHGGAGGASLTPAPRLASIAASVAPQPSTPRGAATVFPLKDAGWTLDPPTGWLFSQVTAEEGPFYLYGYLGTVPVDKRDICHVTKDTEGCNNGAYTLPPGNALVEFETGGLPFADPVARFDHPESGTRTTVGGMATIYSEEGVAPDRVRLHWQIARPDAFGGSVDVMADIRGPDMEPLREQVESMMASFRFVPPPLPLPEGAAAERGAAASALTRLRTNEADAYACFPGEPGTSRPWHVTALPSTGGSTSIDAICATKVERTDIGFWKVTFTITWDAAVDRPAGSLYAMAWISPDGSMGGTQVGGDPS